MTTSRFVAAAVVLGCFGASSANFAADAFAPDAFAPVGMMPVDAPLPGAEAPSDLPSTVTATAELAELLPPYSAYAGVDYGPLTDPPPTVPITDIGEGLITVDALECAETCTLTAGCNSASYYGDNPSATWPGGQNCYLKTLVGCVLPADALMTGDATVFMIGGPDCELAAGSPIAAGPLAALGPITDQPGAAPIDIVPVTPPATPLAAPVPEAVPPTTVGTGADAPSTTTDQTGLESPDQAGDPLADVATPETDAIGGLRGYAVSAVLAVVGAVVLI